MRMADLKAVVAVQNIRYDKQGETLYIMDQTLLPGQEREIALTTAEQMVEAIRALRVRGAPAIGICAAYCMYVLARSIQAETAEDFLIQLEQYGQTLNSARPTAVNLSWAVGQMLKTARENRGMERTALLEALYQKAVDIHRDDIE